MAREKFLEIIVIKTDQMIFRGMAKSFSSINDQGKFDILPDHQNFISIIKNYMIIRTTSGKNHHIDIEEAVLHLKNNKLVVFTGIKNL